MLVRIAPRTNGSSATSRELTFEFVRCWHCEPYMGKTEAKCLALQTLDCLDVELEEQDGKVQEYEVRACAYLMLC